MSAGTVRQSRRTVCVPLVASLSLSRLAFACNVSFTQLAYSSALILSASEGRTGWAGSRRRSSRELTFLPKANIDGRSRRQEVRGATDRRKLRRNRSRFSSPRGIPASERVTFSTSDKLSLLPTAIARLTAHPHSPSPRRPHSHPR
ncbi:hypothetical protein BJY59DRAFT_496115 [Rhodotorula toruloides]